MLPATNFWEVVYLEWKETGAGRQKTCCVEANCAAAAIAAIHQQDGCRGTRMARSVRWLGTSIPMREVRA